MAYIPSLICFSIAIAIAFAGHSIALVLRAIMIVTGWLAALVAVALAGVFILWLGLTYIAAAFPIPFSHHVSFGAFAACLAALTILAVRLRNASTSLSESDRADTPSLGPTRAEAPLRANEQDAILALVKLGYGRREALIAVATAARQLGDDVSAAMLVRNALKERAVDFH
jgi:hypothetical protein